MWLLSWGLFMDHELVHMAGCQEEERQKGKGGFSTQSAILSNSVWLLLPSHLLELCHKSYGHNLVAEFARKWKQCTQPRIGSLLLQKRERVDVVVQEQESLPPCLSTFQLIRSWITTCSCDGKIPKNWPCPYGVKGICEPLLSLHNPPKKEKIVLNH